MKASRFTEAQKAFILKQGEEGTQVAEICRKTGISQATYFNWKKRYGGLLPDEMRRLKGKHPTKTAFRITARFETLCLFPGIAAVS